MNSLLHPEYFDIPIIGNRYEQLMWDGAQAADDGSFGKQDPDVTILVRTRDHAHRLTGIIADIQAQKFDGEVQLVVVDTESQDGTVELARKSGATVLALSQASFNYAQSLNLGFERADHPFVVTLTGRSSLSNAFMLRSLTRWHDQSDRFGGIYGAALPDKNATLGDQAVYALQHNLQRLQPAEKLEAWKPGAMVAHRSIVSRAAWQELGGYDERYARGGEDTDFARRLIEADFDVIRDPAVSVHHGYGLGVLGTMHHIIEMRRLRHLPPQDFQEQAYRTGAL